MSSSGIDLTGMKYIRHEYGGFIVWPTMLGISHQAVAELVRAKGMVGAVVSAGFVQPGSELICHGRSEGLDLDSGPDDTELLRRQNATGALSLSASGDKGAVPQG